MVAVIREPIHRRSIHGGTFGQLLPAARYWVGRSARISYLPLRWAGAAGHPIGSAGDPCISQPGTGLRQVIQVIAVLRHAITRRRDGRGQARPGRWHR